MERSPELEDLVSQWFAAATRGDASLVDDHVSMHPGTCLIGSDPAEWFSGGEAVAQFLRGEVISAGGAAQFAPKGQRHSRRAPWGGRPPSSRSLCPTVATSHRVGSSVFHREDDTWRFVHTHASIGVGNDDIGWIYPD